MLFDPAFVDAVYADAKKALADLELSDAEVKQLTAVDRRAWGFDPLRRLRTLRTLVEEFKVSTTLMLAETRSLASLDLFFSSPNFHQVVQQRGSLALAFSQFISDLYQQGELKTPQLPDVLRLEKSLARCRRALAAAGAAQDKPLPAAIDDAARVRLAPGVDTGSFQANTIATIQRVEQYLFEVNLMPAMALCDDAPRLKDLPAVDAKKKIFLLFTPAANGIALVHIERAEFLLLYEARSPLTIRKLLGQAAAAGINTKIATQIITDAIEQRTLSIET
jgi:hypothetical protein